MYGVMCVHVRCRFGLACGTSAGARRPALSRVPRARPPDNVSPSPPPNNITCSPLSSSLSRGSVVIARRGALLRTYLVHYYMLLYGLVPARFWSSVLRTPYIYAAPSSRRPKLGSPAGASRRPARCYLLPAVDDSRRPTHANTPPAAFAPPTCVPLDTTPSRQEQGKTATAIVPATGRHPQRTREAAFRAWPARRTSHQQVGRPRLLYSVRSACWSGGQREKGHGTLSGGERRLVTRRQKSPHPPPPRTLPSSPDRSRESLDGYFSAPVSSRDTLD